MNYTKAEYSSLWNFLGQDLLKNGWWLVMLLQEKSKSQLNLQIHLISNMDHLLLGYERAGVLTQICYECWSPRSAQLAVCCVGWLKKLRTFYKLVLGSAYNMSAIFQMRLEMRLFRLLWRDQMFTQRGVICGWPWQRIVWWHQQVLPLTNFLC